MPDDELLTLYGAGGIRNSSQAGASSLCPERLGEILVKRILESRGAILLMGCNLK